MITGSNTKINPVNKEWQINRNSFRTVFGTREWAEYNANIIDGCSHDCKYCYSKEMAIRFKRKTSATWAVEKLRPSSLNKKITLKSGRIMFPSSHDIHPNHLSPIIDFLGKLLKVGNSVLIVTKPHFKCITKICSSFSEYRNQILFRFTIGSNNSTTLRFWEPGAPSFEERLACLEHAYENDFETSVSCEPALDRDLSSLIDTLLPFVTNSIWIGKPNALNHRLKMNGFCDSATVQKASALLGELSDDYLESLYLKYKVNPIVKWKESVKRVIGLNIPMIAGLDI